MKNSKLGVLNLIINGLPSILKISLGTIKGRHQVLNLIINGLPSIPETMSFEDYEALVLNLIINGLPSIPHLIM